MTIEEIKEVVIETLNLTPVVANDTDLLGYTYFHNVGVSSMTYLKDVLILLYHKTREGGEYEGSIQVKEHKIRVHDGCGENGYAVFADIAGFREYMQNIK